MEELSQTGGNKGDDNKMHRGVPDGKGTLVEKLVKSRQSLEFNRNVPVLVITCNKCTLVV